MSLGLQLAVAMTLSGLVLAGCATLTEREDGAVDRALAAFKQRESVKDLEECAAAYGQNFKTLRQCVDERQAIRQAQLLELRQALRERRLRTSQTSCLNPITGAAEMCQEI